MYRITLTAFNKIHSDYRGWHWTGKRSALNASIRSAAGLNGWGDLPGTALLIEGVHFEIVEPVKLSGQVVDSSEIELLMETRRNEN